MEDFLVRGLRVRGERGMVMGGMVVQVGELAWVVGAKPTVIEVWQRPSRMVSGPPHRHTAAVRAGPSSHLRGGGGRGSIRHNRQCLRRIKK